jgi:hypothetical protein
MKLGEEKFRKCLLPLISASEKEFCIITEAVK